MASFLTRLTETAKAASAFARVAAKSWAEGSWRGPFFGRGELSGAMFELGSIEDGFQRNLSVTQSDARHVPMVYAAVMANAKAAATCWPKHRREKTKGSLKFEDVRTSPAARLFRDANPYETWPVFLLNMVATMGFDGQAYALAVRDDRYAVTQLHRMPRGSMTPIISPEDGSIYYAVGVNPFLPDLSQVAYVVPARDVWHLRQHCPRNPLLGEPACNAAALAMGMNVALSQSQTIFFARMSRPSGVLTSDQQLNLDQMTRLRENWAAQSQLLQQGGVPILGNGVKFTPMTITSEDSQLQEAYRMSGEDIARVYGVPLPVVGELSHATLNNVEQLVSLWLSTGLSSMLELIERDLNRLLGFDGYSEYVDLDTKALLRTDFAARIDALTKGIQGALFKPNEARAFEDLPPVDGGDDVYAQAQMQPLGTPLPAPAPAPADPVDPNDPNADAPPGDQNDAQGANDDGEASSKAAMLAALQKAAREGYGALMMENDDGLE